MSSASFVLFLIHSLDCFLFSLSFSFSFSLSSLSPVFNLEMPDYFPLLSLSCRCIQYTFLVSLPLLLSIQQKEQEDDDWRERGEATGWEREKLQRLPSPSLVKTYLLCLLMSVQWITRLSPVNKHFCLVYSFILDQVLKKEDTWTHEDTHNFFLVLYWPLF